MKKLLLLPYAQGFLPLVSVAASAFVFGALPAHADQLFDDTFGTGSANANGWYFYNNNAGGTSWDIASSPPSGATLISGKSLRNNLGSASNTVALKPLGEFNFNAVGDSISVSLSFHASGTSGALYGLGFYEMTNAITANSFGGTNLANASAGYTFYMTLANNTTATIRDSANTTDATSSNTSSIGNSVDHTLTLTMTLTSDGLVVSNSIDGTKFVSYTNTSVTATSGFAINTLKLAANGSVSYFDNITVTTSTAAIPEAGTTWYVVAAAGAAALLLVRRRLNGRAAQVVA